MDSCGNPLIWNVMKYIAAGSEDCFIAFKFGQIISGEQLQAMENIIIYFSLFAWIICSVVGTQGICIYFSHKPSVQGNKSCMCCFVSWTEM